MKSNLLIQEPPLQVLPSLALAIGLNEAIFLQQLHYWIHNPKVGIEIDGYKWIHNTYAEWKVNFPFWSERTIRRIATKLEEDGVIISRQRENSYDKTKYYRINYDNMDIRCGQLDRIEEDSEDASTLTETTTKNTIASKKNTRAPSPATQAAEELIAFFLEITGLPDPKPVTNNQKEWRVYNAMWLKYARMILQWVDWNTDHARTLVRDTVDRMRKDRLTIHSMKSIEKVAADEYGRRNS